MTDPGPASERPLPDNLSRWVAAQLISSEQAQRIARFEDEQSALARSGRAARAVALLGALALASGIGSLVAYNWDRFGDGVKLGGMGALLLLSMLSVLWVKAARAGVDEAGGRAAPTALDVTLLVGSGLTLSGLSLISQIYHQDAELWQLLFAWSLATAPLMSFARTRFAHAFWFAGLFFSLATAFEDSTRLLRDSFGLDSDHAAWGVLLTFATASVVLAERWGASRLPGRAAVGRLFVAIFLVVLGLFGGLFWFHGETGSPLLWLLGLLAGGAIWLAAPESLAKLGWGTRKEARLLFATGLALSVIPMGFRVDSGFLAFLAFLAFWVLAWRFAERSGSTRIARMAVFFVGSRIVIASFELFESLLLTGVVLVGLGTAALIGSRHSLSRAKKAGAAHG